MISQNNTYLKRIKHVFMIRLFFISIVALFLLSETRAQSNRIDSLTNILITSITPEERVQTSRRLFSLYVNSNPDSAMRYARQTFDLTLGSQDHISHGQSIMDLTHAYYRKRDFDSTRIILLNAVPFYESTNQFDKVAACYRNLAAIGEKMEQPDTSLVYLEKCIEVLSQHPDSSILGQAFLSKGFAYRTKGFYELSIQALLHALRIFEKMDDERRMGYVTQNLGMTYAQTGREDDAIEYSLKSIEHSTAGNNLRAVGQSLNNLGILYKKKNEMTKAADAHHRSISISEQTNQPTVILNNYFNLGKLYFENQALDSSAYYFNQMETLANELDYEFYQSATYRFKALLSLKQKNRASAKTYLARAESFNIDYADPQENIDANEELSEIHSELGNFKEALKYWKQANMIIDSVHTLKRDQQVEELALIYETEKKDAAITLLNKNAELDATKRKALWLSLILLGLTALTIIYTLIQRRRKEKQILEKEKEIEIQKRLNLEQELEFKKKELTAKVLQLAHKNEFLNSLQGEVSQLKSSIDDSVNDTSRRISRMIQHDTADDDEWDQFGKEFSSIHQDFIDRLVAKHGEFSKNDLRLIALLKMKLSSKDIANTLRISSDGIKKARYRLRKKLGIESSVDLQGYLLSF
jgi:tetratricopeptide (TPR) repeat protein